MLKERRKLILVILIVGIVLLLLPLVCVTLPWVILFFGAHTMYPNPPEPQIKQAEFPFTLTYEIDGEEKVIQDTLICEYDGIEINGADFTKYRNWISRLASGGEEIVLWTGKSAKGNRQELCYVTSPEYYMGDTDIEEEFPGQMERDQWAVVLTTYDSDGWESERGISEKKLFEKFGIRLLEWSCAPPIENQFLTDGCG